MSSQGRYNALVLAAQRSREGDPLAPFCNNGNKNLIDVHGRPMVAWVLETLLEASEIDQVLVSIEDPNLLQTAIEGISSLQNALDAGTLVAVPAQENLYQSVLSALSHEGVDRCPAIITTADNPLLTPEMIRHFTAQTDAQGAEAAVAMVSAPLMKARYPEGQRRFYAFRGGEYSNCNLYALTTETALDAARAFEGGGQFRKKLSRIVKAFGLASFVLYALRIRTLAGFGQHLSRQLGIRLRFVTMPFPEACIDVDNERTLRIAREIFLERDRACRPIAGTA